MKQRTNSFLLIATFFLSFLSLNVFANEYGDFCSGRFAVQAGIATGGNVGIGVVHYTEHTEIGATIAGRINNSQHATKTATPVIFGGYRQSIWEGTYLAFGINASNTFGTYVGHKIECDYTVGPYISLEQMLTHHVMLVVYINPYQYEYGKIKHQSSLTTQSFFSAGGIGLNYVF